MKIAHIKTLRSAEVEIFKNVGTIIMQGGFLYLKLAESEEYIPAHQIVSCITTDAA